MISRRDFLESMVLFGSSFLLPEFLIAEDCFDNAPRVDEYAGRKDRCSAYSRIVAQDFGKYFNRGAAWIFAEGNKSIAKVEDIKKYHFNEWWIDFFAEKGKLNSGMILGAYYSNSKWNGKSYTPDGKVWKRHKGEWHRFRGSGLQGEVLSEELVGSLEEIEYTHLLCYAGRDCDGKHICWHQFPYGGVVRQESIKVDELEKYRLFVKEIIDVSREKSR